MFVAVWQRCAGRSRLALGALGLGSLLGDDLDAPVDALVADVDAGAGDQLVDLALGLATKRARQDGGGGLPFAGSAPPEPHRLSFLLGAQPDSWRRSRRCGSWKLITSSTPRAAAARSRVFRLGATRPASRRAMAGWVLPIRRASSAWLRCWASRSARSCSPSPNAPPARSE